MKLGKEAQELGRVFNAYRQFEWLLGLIVLITSWFTVSIVTFTRRDFGERYLSWVNLFFGYTVVVNFAFLGNLLGVAAGGSFSFLMTSCWLAFVIGSFYHRWVIRRKNKAGVEWHSLNIGTSFLSKFFSEELIYKLIEPLLVGVMGLLVFPFAHVVGIWLLISSASLLVNNHLVYHFQRQQYLDIRDADIFSRNLARALAGKPAKETGGYVLAGSTIQLVRRDAGLQHALANLSPELKGIFDAPLPA